MIFGTLRMNNHPNYISSNSSRNISINYGGLYLGTSLPVAIEFSMWLRWTHTQHTWKLPQPRRNTIAWQRWKPKTYLRAMHPLFALLPTNINYLRHAIHFINYKCHHGMTSRFDVPMCLVRKENHFCHLCPSPATSNVPSPIIVIM